MKKAKISGTGFYVPPKVVTNYDLEKLMDTSDEWIRERTGIVERRYVEEGVGPADLALEASRQALAEAGCEPDDLDFIIFATLSPEYFFPGSGCLLQEKLGLPTIGALDVRSQCCGFVYGLSIADQYIKTGMYERILVVGAEVQSVGINFSTEGRDLAVLFGDGAGAVVVEPSEDDSRGILSTHLHADGRYVKELWLEEPTILKHPRISHEMVDRGRWYPEMNGRQVFKHAVVRFAQVIIEGMEANHMTPDEIDLLILHQANLRICEATQKRLGLTPDKLYNNIQRYGNTTAASIPIALAEAIRGNRIKRGDLVMLAAFGSGFTWASAVIRW